MLKLIFVFLLTHFSVGLLFTILFISLKEIGKLYFRVTTLVACALIVFALLAKPFGDLAFFPLFNFNETNQVFSQKLTYFFFLAAALFLIIYNIIHPRFHKSFLALSFIFGILGISSYSIAIYQPLLLDSRMEKWVMQTIHDEMPWAAEWACFVNREDAEEWLESRGVPNSADPTC